MTEEKKNKCFVFVEFFGLQQPFSRHYSKDAEIFPDHVMLTQNPGRCENDVIPPEQRQAARIDQLFFK